MLSYSNWSWYQNDNEQIPSIPSQIPMNTLSACPPHLDSLRGQGERSTLVISHQLRYIVYGSSNLTLKKDELSAYGSGAAASEDDSDVQTVMRTTKPSSALPFHFLLRPISSMKGLTYCTEGSLREGVGIKPHSCANMLRMVGG